MAAIDHPESRLRADNLAVRAHWDELTLAGLFERRAGNRVLSGFRSLPFPRPNRLGKAMLVTMKPTLTNNSRWCCSTSPPTPPVPPPLPSLCGRLLPPCARSPAPLRNALFPARTSPAAAAAAAAAAPPPPGSVPVLPDSRIAPRRSLAIPSPSPSTAAIVPTPPAVLRLSLPLPLLTPVMLRPLPLGPPLQLPDGNQLVSFTPHGLFSHVPQRETGRVQRHRRKKDKG